MRIPAPMLERMAYPPRCPPPRQPYLPSSSYLISEERMLAQKGRRKDNRVVACVLLLD